MTGGPTGGENAPMKVKCHDQSGEVEDCVWCSLDGMLSLQTAVRQSRLVWFVQCACQLYCKPIIK